VSLAAASLLAACVLSAWLAALALLRLRDALDRLHALGFLNLVAGIFAAAAVWVHDGASARAGKVLILVLVALAAGSVLIHATARALHRRRPQTAKEAQ